ncbi:dynein regulatory complex protein 1 isoform X2 [Cydia splendana]
MQKLEAEAEDSQARYELITANWDVMLTVKDPLDIQAAMKEQKEKCDFLLAQKTKMIDELKNDLKLMDIAYYDDLEKQDKDIKELSDRIEKQVSIMQRAYQKQLALIQEAIEIERDAMVDHNNKRWDALYRQRDKEEVAHMESKSEQLEEHKLEMEAIMWDHHEKFRVAKIELEVLIQELQKELQKLKATCIINTEKIGYTYQVLKKREEENVFVRSQQKRKINKMSDVANKLRAKIRKAAEDGAIEEMKADAEIVKLMQAMDDLEKKSYQFSHVNNYKFSQIWRMSMARCTELAKQLRLVEVALHAHILSEPPPPPPPPLPKNPLWKYEHEASSESQAVAIFEEEPVDPKDMVAKTAKDKLVRHILQLVADNTGFLVEDRLLKLIEKYQLTSRNLCTLDSIFMALEIQAEEDIELLCKVFLNYAFCPVCVETDNESESVEQSSIPEDVASRNTIPRSVRGDRSSVRARSSVAKSVSASSRLIHVGFRGQELSPSDVQLMTEADEIIQKCGELSVGTAGTGAITESGVSPSQRRPHARGVTVTSQLSLAKSIKAVNTFLCPLGHYLEIEPMQVLTALAEFVSVFVPPEKRRLYDILDSVKPPDFTTPSRKLKSEEIQQYWMEWKDVFPSEKDKFWDGMLSALNNYLPILQERERLHEEVCGLRRRNAALRRLMRGALPELPVVQPKYMGSYPKAFTSTIPDDVPSAYSRLPPI